jgi:hypothetical protein
MAPLKTHPPRGKKISSFAWHSEAKTWSGPHVGAVIGRGNPAEEGRVNCKTERRVWETF